MSNHRRIKHNHLLLAITNSHSFQERPSDAGRLRLHVMSTRPVIVKYIAYRSVCTSMYTGENPPARTQQAPAAQVAHPCVGGQKKKQSTQTHTCKGDSNIRRPLLRRCASRRSWGPTAAPSPAPGAPSSGASPCGTAAWPASGSATWRVTSTWRRSPPTPLPQPPGLPPPRRPVAADPATPPRQPPPPGRPAARACGRRRSPPPRQLSRGPRRLPAADLQPRAPHPHRRRLWR